MSFVRLLEKLAARPLALAFANFTITSLLLVQTL
jgi:hypothetical protein